MAEYTTWGAVPQDSGPYPPDSGRSSGAPLPDSPYKQRLRQYVQEVIDGENPPRGDEFFSVNFLNHDPAPGEQPGLEGVKAFIGSIFAAFSGFRTNINEQVASGDLVVGRWTQTFKQTGSYLGFPVSGNQVLIGGITITRVRDNKIVEEWEARDAAGLLQQLGVAPKLRLEGGDSMSSADVEGVAHRFFYDAWNGGQINLIDELFAPDFVNHILLEGQMPGREGIKQFVSRFNTAFPGGTVSVDLTVREQDRVVVRWTARGVHKDSFMGIAATGRPVDFTGITIFRIAGRKIVECWGYWEIASMLSQLGVLKFPGQGDQPPGGQPPYSGGQPPYSGGQPPYSGGQPPYSGGGSPTAIEDVARRWFDAINTGDERMLDALVSPDVTDHSGLSSAHGRGCDGHKRLVRELRRALPDWRSTIEEVKVQGDKVTIRHRGQGTAPFALRSLAPNVAGGHLLQFEMVSTIRVKDGKVVEHWANEGPFGTKGGPGWPTHASQEQLKDIARRWFDAINVGNTAAIDELVGYDVVDHSGLSGMHGYGCDGHKKLVSELKRAIPDWRSQVEDISVNGDKVTVRHRGRGTPPPQFAGILGPNASAPIDFEMISTLRIENGKIVEHWAHKGPFGAKVSSNGSAAGGTTLTNRFVW